MKYFLPVLLLLTMTTACHSSKKAIDPGQTDMDLKPWVLKFDRSPCFGECPVYTFYLLADFHGLIEVKANLLPAGWYYADLDQEAVHEILMDIEPESLWTEDLTDQPEIADLPLLSLVYKHKDGLRMVATQGKISNRVATLTQKLSHLISESKWDTTSLRPLDPTIAEPADVIVQLKANVDIQVWMKKFDQYGIRLKKRVAPNLDYYVLSKDPGMGDANEFLQKLKRDPDVINAQWDQALSPRDK